jgi:hypothetical protein
MAGEISEPWRAIFGWPNWIDGAVTVTGGSWRTSAPVQLVADRAFAAGAWSEDRHPASTRFDVAFQGELKPIRVVAIPRLVEGTRDAKVRVRLYDGTALAADSGWRPVFEVIYPWGSLPFGHASWWDGRMTLGEAAATPMPWIWVLDATVVASRVAVEIDDRSGPTQSIGVPRLFVCPGWQPTFNMSYGATIEVEDESAVELAYGGAEHIDIQARRRVVRCSLDYLDEDEALVWILDTRRREGIAGQGFFCWNPADVVHRHRRSFPCRQRSLSPIEARAHRLTGAAFELSEVLA